MSRPSPPYTSVRSAIPFSSHTFLPHVFADHPWGDPLDSQYLGRDGVARMALLSSIDRHINQGRHSDHTSERRLHRETDSSNASLQDMGCKGCLPFLPSPPSSVAIRSMYPSQQRYSPEACSCDCFICPPCFVHLGLQCRPPPFRPCHSWLVDLHLPCP